jgi:hypothetical protein
MDYPEVSVNGQIDKGKAYSRTGHEGPDRGGWSSPRVGRCIPGKETR